MNKITLDIFIAAEQQGEYIQLPFTMPPEVESLNLSYQYPGYHESDSLIGTVSFTERQQVNIIDLGLVAPDGEQVGASGASKSTIYLSEVSATPGYQPCRLVPGEWRILVGAYRVAPGGVHVNYELAFNYKHRRLLKGDLHVHTLASDGLLTAEELAWRAVRHGLDFLAITDHNQMVSRQALPEVNAAGRAPVLTLIPGVEWTHFQGHANFLGIDRPYDEPFAANTLDEIQARFNSARRRGALITINHPFEEDCGFRIDLQSVPFDLLEIWNGPMCPANLKTIGLWQNWLAAGRKIPACGGSDYHRDTPFIFLGGPTTCVHTLSAGPSDILSALREGHTYITYAPNGPWLELTAGEAIVGDTVEWRQVKELEIRAGDLLPGDLLRVVTAASSETILEAPSAGSARVTYPMAAPGFARVEIWRAFLPGVPLLPALLSNPIYFESGL